jgi:hypothetical protein
MTLLVIRFLQVTYDHFYIQPTQESSLESLSHTIDHQRPNSNSLQSDLGIDQSVSFSFLAILGHDCHSYQEDHVKC